MTYDNTDAIGSTAQLAHISLVRPLEFCTRFTKTDRIDFIDKYWLSMTVLIPQQYCNIIGTQTKY